MKYHQISSSLYDALQEFRQHGEELVLWADQLCIDQLNLDERNHQVSIMGKIYRRSERCMAFVGKTTEADVQALALLDKVVEYWNGSCQTGMPSEGNTELLEDTETLNLPKRSDITWQYLRNLITRPWFPRVWVIQEAVLPPECKVLVGRYCFSLISLKSLIEMLHAKSLGALLSHGLGPDERAKWLQTLVQIANLVSFLPSETRDEEPSFAHILHKTRVAASSDPRDKVFGILGLSTFSDPETVPDYRLSVQEVYCRTARALIKRGDGLKVLFTAAINARQGMEGLPSWVPDWRMVNVKSEAWFEAYHDYRCYEAKGSEAASVQVLADPMCVSARGSFVDSIYQQTEVFRGQSTEDVLMITEQMLEWRAVAEQGMDVAEVTEQVYPKVLYIPLSALRYQRIFWGTCHARRFCTTLKGYFGVVPQQARPGDRICVFPGEDLPFLLRLREDFQSYEAIGRCYVHGISNGEAWNRDAVKAEDIVIS